VRSSPTLARALALALLASLLVGVRAHAAAPGRPNVLLIVSDDQSWSTFDRELMPAVFGELVDHGVLFDRAYVNSALCCPSRSEILTGLYEHHTGVDGNGVHLTRPTIVQALHDLGYRTALAGKYLNSWPCEPRPEFDQWMCSGHKPSSYSLVDPYMNVNGAWTRFTGYTVQIQAEFLARFIARTPPGRPFFALYAPTSPHLPANDDRYATLPVEPIRDPGFDQDTWVRTEPTYLRRGPLTSTQQAAIDADHAAMARAVRALDDSVATLLASLGDRERDTLVIYLSDNGYLYGEHRWEGKRVPYEEAVRVPLVVRYPPLRPESEPAISHALVENVDLAPTIAALVGIPWGADGTSIAPLLSDPAGRVRDAVLIEQCRGVIEESRGCNGLDVGGTRSVPSFWGIVTERYVYVEYATGEAELYDLAADPAELRNLAGDSTVAGVRRKLLEELESLRAPPPVETTIVAGPTGEVAGRVATFTFFSQSRFATYRCRLDRDGVPGGWIPCPGGSITLGSLEDGSYSFAVSGTDERGETDSTPAVREFTVSSSGPAVTIDSAPPTLARPGFLSFSFSSPVAGATFECAFDRLGAPYLTWRPCDPATGAVLYEPAPGWWSFQVRAADPVTGQVTDPPAEALVRVDRTGPRMTFVERPGAATTATSATVSFIPDEPTRGPVVCRLRGRAPVDCSRGRFHANHLGPGRHLLQIRASDEAGNTATTELAWTVDREAPDARFLLHPRRRSDQPAASFLLGPSRFGGGFLCRLDGRPFMVCPRAPTFSELPDGVHRLTVVAVDAALNRSAPITWTWTQDTVAPITTIESGPPSPTASTSATFAFSATETDVRYMCSIDGLGFLRCASGVSYEGLAPGSHSFAVHAIDAAGNVGPDATWSWTIG